MTTLTPVNQFVLVSVERPVERTTSSGLVMPETATNAFVRAKVVAVSTGVALDDGTFRDPLVAVGDDILVMRTSNGLPGLAVDGEGTTRLIQEDEIAGVFTT